MDTNEQTATEPMNRDFAAVITFINCQRWDIIMKCKKKQLKKL